MTRTEWDALAYRAAMARHKMWCVANEGPTGEREGPCGDDGRILVSCKGPRVGDLSLGAAIATEFWGKRPEKEPDDRS